MVLNRLVEHYGWTDLGKQIDIRCFTHEPSITSSLKFLRRTLGAGTRRSPLYRNPELKPRLKLDDQAALSRNCIILPRQTILNNHLGIVEL